MSSGIITCYLPIVSAKSIGEVNIGDFLIVGQPWRAVSMMDEKNDHLSLSIFCSEVVLKYPSLSSRAPSFDVSACAYIELLPFMSYSSIATCVCNPSSSDSKQPSNEPKLNSVSACSGVETASTKHRGLGHEGMVQATASIIDYESGICMKDLNFAVPVASVFFSGDSCATVCYCSPGDFQMLSEQLVEKHAYSFQRLVKEAYSGPHGFHFQAFIQSRSVQPAFFRENDDVAQSIRFGMGSRCNLQLKHFHQFSFQSRVAHVDVQPSANLRSHALLPNILVPENGHGFGRFRFLHSPVFGCVLGVDGKGLLIPIFMTSRHVADSIFACLSCRATGFDADLPQKHWFIFERLKLVSSTVNDSDADVPLIALADGFTKIVACSCSSTSAPNTACASNLNSIMACHSQSVVILDSFYIGGDQMCPKCQNPLAPLLTTILLSAGIVDFAEGAKVSPQITCPCISL
jgi:hypothetical protein